MTFGYFKWKCVNIVPHFHVCCIATDDGVICAREYQVTLFGWVLCFEVPCTEFQRGWSWPKTLGPLWSRKRKKWFLPE